MVREKRRVLGTLGKERRPAPNFPVPHHVSWMALAWHWDP